jgi:dTDP-4-amino-4,6-dideoxygalactose transaminase
VITVGNSDISTTAAISQCGATPVLCDILERDYTIDVDLVEPLITSRTAAILPVDLYGHPANVKRLRQVADRHGLKIVEDAALACGAADHGQPVGAFADATAFSFAPYKPLGSVGSGGMITTNDDEIALRLRVLAGYGHIPERTAPTPGHQHHLGEGYNVPLDPLQAALLTVKLPHLCAWTARRRAVVRAYEARLQGCAVQLPVFRPESEPTFRQYTVLIRDQRSAYEELLRRGVEVVLHYVPAIYKQPVYVNRKLPGADRLPVTERVTSSLLCLPVTPDLSEEDVAYAANILRSLA